MAKEKKNARNLKHILAKFSGLSGLIINPLKSAIYFGGQVKDRRWITSHLGLEAGDLSVKYLGLPLISKRLSATDSEQLLQAVRTHL